MKIVFEEEKNVNDAGGLMREFIQLLCQELFKPEFSKQIFGKGIIRVIDLFTKTHTEEVMYRINSESPINQRNLSLYHLLGKVIGKAIFEQMSIPLQFDRLLLKQIIQADFELEDLRTYDRQVYSKLRK